MPRSSAVVKQFKENTKAAMRPVKMREPLTPSEFAFCEWFSLRFGKKPPIVEQLKFLNEMEAVDGVPSDYWTPQRLVNLKRRREFQEYYTNLRAEEIDRARAMLIKRMPDAVDSHFKALAMAMAKEDYRAVPALTTPVLDRVMPKKAEITPVTAVKIELTPAQQQNLQIADTVVEVVELDDDA